MKPTDPAAVALRKKAEAALKLEREGRHGEAIARVDGLAAKHKGSALVLHLAGLVHYAAARRAAHSRDGAKATSNHIITAHGYLTEAKRLVPNCIAICDLIASVLYIGLRFDEAERAAREALDIADPVDPADNSVLYAAADRSNSTRDQRVESCRKTARDHLTAMEDRIPRLVRKVLELDTDSHDGAREALKKAKELAKGNPSSSRVQLLSAHMQIQCVRGLNPNMDRRAFLDRIRVAMKEIIASSFGGSLLLALFHAKLCFILGSYEAVYFECIRAYAIGRPVDPRLEDVPPYSIQGDTIEERVYAVDEELDCLINKLFLVADDFRCSMTSEEQDGFLSVRLVELQEYYDTNFENDQWAAQTIMSDALSIVNKNMSWRFWICPFCAGKELPDPNSLLEHMNREHLPKLRSAFDSEGMECVIVDDYLDQITVYQDSEGHHFFRFNKTDYVFKHLSVPSEVMSFAVLQEKIRERGKEILEEIEDKLKRLPAEELSSEFDQARLEIQGSWLNFVQICMLDYRKLIMTLAKPFIWTKLLKSLSEDKGASKISNDDIDVIFPRGEVHAEDEVGRSEIHPNANIEDVQSGVTGLKYQPSIAKENSASNLIGTLL